MYNTSPKDLPEVIAYCIGHEAQIQERWDSQFRYNVEINQRMSVVESRISALEKRVMLVAFFASLIGSGAGGYGVFSMLLGG